MNLYKLSEEEQDLQRQLEDALIETEGEVTEEARRYLDELFKLEGAIENKLDAYYKVLRNLESFSGGLDEEIERLKDRKEKAEKATKWLKGNVLHYMMERDIRELKTSRTTFKNLRRGGQRPLRVEAPKEEIPQEFKKKTIKIVVDPRKLDTGQLDFLYRRLKPLENLSAVDVSETNRVMKSWIKEALEKGELEGIARYEPRKHYLDY